MTGAGRYVIEVTKRLPHLADDLTVEVLLLPELRATSIPATLADAGVKVRYVDAHVASLRQWFVIPKVLERLRPDLYHYPFLDLPYTRCPSVVTIYDLNPILHLEYFDRFRGLKRAISRRLIGSTLRRSRAALAISEATRGLIQEHYPEFAHKVRTIHLGVDPAAWAGPQTEKAGHAGDPASQGTLWQSRPYVLYVGVDRPHKNLLRLVRAFGRFRLAHGWQGRTGPYLWLAGVGHGPSQLSNQISEMSLIGDVRLDRELEEADVRMAYLGARVLAYVSTSEGFGLPLLEALAAGVPVVTADVSSLPEIGGNAVLYTNPHDEVAMSEALDRLWTDTALRKTLIERGRVRLQEFTWDATTAATLKAYYDVLRWESTVRQRRDTARA